MREGVNKKGMKLIMKGKTKLRVIQILCIVSLLITVFSIQKTYARYFEKVDTKYNTHIKRWVINVNEKNIHRENSLSNVMTPVFRENTHINGNDILVPGSEGYFEFLIDYSKVDLKFRFEFDIEQLNKKTITEGNGESQTQTEIDNHLEDFEIYGYSIVETRADSGETVETITLIEHPNNMSELTQLIDPNVNSDVNKTRTVRILFRWNDTNADTTDDIAEDGMNNFEDTQYRGNANGENLHTLLNYNVKITFTQQL